MCGIVGYVKKSTRRKIDPQFLEDALIACKSRGRDATGMFYVSGSTGILLKDGVDADDFIKKNKKELECVASSAKMVIAHCRASTFGRKKSAPASNNNNNHPFEGKRWVIVHNGMFKESPEVKKYKYASDCDSEIVLSYLEKWGIDGLHKLSSNDSFSLVMYDKQEGKLYFLRNKNPMVISVDTIDNVLYFASTEDIVYEFGGVMTQDDIGIPIFSMSKAINTAEHQLYEFNISAFKWTRVGEKFEFEGCPSKWKKDPELDFVDKKDEFPFYSSAYSNHSNKNSLSSHVSSVTKSEYFEVYNGLRLGVGGLCNFFEDDCHPVDVWRLIVDKLAA